MKRQLLILDVTEMSGQNVCIAGIDLKSLEHVRLSSPSPTRTTVRSLTLLQPGDVLTMDYEFDRKRIKPHTEDARWSRLTARKTARMSLAELTRAIETRVFPSVEEAFGVPWLRGSGNNHGWRPELGNRSLATITVRHVSLEQDKGRKPRIHLVDGAGKHWRGIPFQDLRVKSHGTECNSCESEYVENLCSDFATAGRALVRVGLTRPFASGPTASPACWLQVTNVFARERTHFI